MFSPPIVELPTWTRPTAKQSWIVLGLMFGMFLVMQVVAAVVMIAMSFASTGDPLKMLQGSTLPLSVIALGVMATSVSLLAPTIGATLAWRLRPRETFALHRAPGWVYPCAILGMFAYQILVGAMLAAVTAAVKRMIPHLDMTAMMTQLAKSVQTESPVRWLGLFALIAALPGTYEELVFRGFLQRGFESRYHPALAILLSSLFFGVIHGDPFQGLGAMCLGFYLGFLVYRTGSIYPSIAAHLLQNTFFLAVNQLPSQHSLRRADEHAPLWALGIALVVVAVMVAIICRFSPRPERNPAPVRLELSPIPVVEKA